MTPLNTDTATKDAAAPDQNAVHRASQVAASTVAIDAAYTTDAAAFTPPTTTSTSDHTWAHPR